MPFLAKLQLKQRNKKELSIDKISWNPILSISEEDKGDIVITYKNEIMNDLNLIVGKLTNTGNLPITTNDFETPIEFDFGPNAKIISNEIIETYPPKMDVETFIKTNKFYISPLLLNKDDSITIKFLITDPSPHISINSRIIGVQKVKEQGVNRKGKMRLMVLGTFLITLGLTLFTILAPPSPVTKDQKLELYIASWPGLAQVLCK